MLEVDPPGLDAPPTLIPPEDELLALAAPGVSFAGADVPLGAPGLLPAEPDVLVTEPRVLATEPDVLPAETEALPEDELLPEEDERLLEEAEEFTDARFVPFPQIPRPLWAWPAGLAAAIAVAAIPFALVLTSASPLPPPAAPVPESLATVVPAPVVAPAPPRAPEPILAPPEARELPSAEEVVAAPPPPRPGTGRVTVEGDASEIWLESTRGRVRPGAEVPAGSYEVRASFGNGMARPAGRVVVPAGGSVRLRCASFVYACAEIRS